MKNKDKRKMHRAIKLKIFQIIIICLLGFLVTLFMISTGFEVFGKTSVYGLNNFPTIPLFAQAPAIYEVIAIIGFSSLLIGLIYANMDKKMLGLDYSIILRSVFNLYNICSICHVIAVLCCVAFSSTGYTEGAWLSLGVVFLGSVYQVCVVYNLIFNSKCCEELARFVWNKRLTTSGADLSNDLCCLAREIPEKGTKYYDLYLECFAHLFIGYANTSKENESSNLKVYSDIWYIFLHNSNVSCNEVITEDFILELLRYPNLYNKENECTDALCRITSGYIVSYINDMRIKNDNHLDFHLIFQEIHKYKYGFDIENNYLESVLNCIYTNVYLLMWIYFWFNETELTYELITDELPKAKNDKYIKEILNMLFKSVYKQSFVGTEILDIAMAQLDGRLKKSNEE